MRRCCNRAARQAGLTMIELIITIVVLGIAAVAVLQSLGFLVLANVDPMLRSQSRLLAESMVNEIQTKAFFNPSLTDDPVLNPNATGPINVCPTPESVTGNNRSVWNNICDYNGYDSGSAGPSFRNGIPIPELAGYRVQASVDASTGLTLGTGLSNQAGCVPQVARIAVTVTDPRGQQLTLDAYRTSYYNDPNGGC